MGDVTQLMPLLQAVPSVRSRRGRPRRRPEKIYADRGYDHDKYHKQVRTLGVTPVIARRGTEHGSGLGAHRWVVEQSFALLHWFRRLRIRWEIRDDIHEAFLSLACSIICWRRLKNLALCQEFLARVCGGGDASEEEVDAGCELLAVVVVGQLRCDLVHERQLVSSGVRSPARGHLLQEGCPVEVRRDTRACGLLCRRSKDVVHER
ncbi:hypothetical protein GCM10010358_82400 [Streptomyces minutiscleroticus]|uniref:Transposase IS4-like domain-containing protein n=1 Tax=Streptomyces minutiscleroticus TaxID=68238 RepID=A0A918P470_9ACTN|nr:hypothetical protein GCM10010358_82400 [Streptomyces minutiscleroticus]